MWEDMEQESIHSVHPNSHTHYQYLTKTLCAPQFCDYHRSYLAMVAFNLEKIFSCIAEKSIVPVCQIYKAKKMDL